ncbi:hypothetical protein ANN_18474 [Periplaneta americana]|uniref:Uncharacterized protein n=1 Tax=Periplaneta americana TaxID=6978 RepID=A0ABQ8SQY4_PERAM|nr:hypothetical protein ANN_18474 [Periplaneta americana]
MAKWTERGLGSHSAETEEKEEKELVGSLAEKKLSTEGCTGRNGEREKSLGRAANDVNSCLQAATELGPHGMLSVAGGSALFWVHDSLRDGLRDHGKDALISPLPDWSGREAVAKFREATGHDCLAGHLRRLEILASPQCMLCSIPVIMDSKHIMCCPSLSVTGFVDRYLEARDKMMKHLPTNSELRSGAESIVAGCPLLAGRAGFSLPVQFRAQKVTRWAIVAQQSGRSFSVIFVKCAATAHVFSLCPHELSYLVQRPLPHRTIFEHELLALSGMWAL